MHTLNTEQVLTWATDTQFKTSTGN